MARIVPIKALMYSEKAGILSDLIAPPYDVIDEEKRKDLSYKQSYNAIHLELAEPGEDRDQRVKNTLNDWIKSGVLTYTDEEHFFAYEQEFSEQGTIYKRRALFCGVESRSWENGAVKPHEFTLSAPKVDRLSLLKNTETQFSPVFMLAKDRSGQLSSLLAKICDGSEATAIGTVDNVTHRIWMMPATEDYLRMLAPLLSESFYIADGHHRYETSYAYKSSIGTQSIIEHPANYCLTALVPSEDSGLIIRSLHRIVPNQVPSNWEKKLSKYFTIESVSSSNKQDYDDSGILALGLENPNSKHLLMLSNFERLRAEVDATKSDLWLKTQANILRYGVLDSLWGFNDEDLRSGSVAYTHLAEEVKEEVLLNSATGFLLKPLSVDEVLTVADGGERLPQKSTFFHPKIGSGLLFYPLLKDGLD